MSDSLTQTNQELELTVENCSSISGTVWHDINGDGEQTGAEPFLPGITVQCANSTSGILTTQTDEEGNYRFVDSITSGRHIIGVIGLTNIAVTKPDEGPHYDINLATGQQLTDLDFGVRLPASISGTVWNDLDCDGNKDSGEPGLDDWNVWVKYNNMDDVQFVEFTDENGNYKFEDLYFAGLYEVWVEDNEADQSFPSDAGSHSFNLQRYDVVTGKDFGYCPPEIKIDNGVVLDMDISTTDYESTNPDSEIESQVSACQDDDIWIAVAALGVTDLDTYQVEVSFDTDKLEFLEGAEEYPMGGISNLLKKNGGTTTGFLAVENTPGTVNISDTLTGADCNQAPEGSGALALLKFRVLDGDPDAALTLGNVFFLDCTGGIEEITDLRNGKVTLFQPMPCDFNPDGIVNFIDLGLLANHWLLECGDTNWDTKYDLNGDCITNFLDLQVFGDLWLEESPCFDE